MNRDRLRQILCRLCIIVISCLPMACKKDDVYLYDRTGFKPKTYRGVYPGRYVPYNKPSSRNYNNPYNNPPKQYYPYYDHDYYYVPPVYYNNVEPDYSAENPR